MFTPAARRLWLRHTPARSLRQTLRQSQSQIPKSWRFETTVTTVKTQKPTFEILQYDTSLTSTTAADYSQPSLEPSESSESQSLPDWFVDEAYLPTSSSSTPSSSQMTPSDLPSYLVPLCEQLSNSPFIDPESVIFSKKDGEWRAIACMKEGRERGVRAAIGETASWVRRTRGFPVAGTLRVSGLTDRRSGGTTDWAIIDTRYVTIHIMTRQARIYYDIDGWGELATEEEKASWEF